jgi:hypothetical protein
MSFLDSGGSPVNVELVSILYAGTVISRNSSGQNISSFNASIPSGHWDIQVNNGSLNSTFSGVNISGSLSWNLSIETDTDYAGVSLPASTRAFARVFSLESSENFSMVSLRGSYNPARLISEPRARIYACHTWNMTARACGAWESVPSLNGTVYTANDTFSITSSTLSAFALAEYVTCGDSIIDPGEECDGANYGGSSCETFDFETGDLACTGSCSFDTSDCSEGGGGPSGDGPADTNGNCIIELDELLAYIDKWHDDSTAYPMHTMISAISKWKAGNAC